MSFSISAAGKPADVAQAVQDAPGHGDTSQLDTVKALLTAELEAWPARGVLVEASGHRDAHGGYLTISIKPINLAGPPAVQEE